MTFCPISSTARVPAQPLTVAVDRACSCEGSRLPGLGVVLLVAGHTGSRSAGLDWIGILVLALLLVCHLARTGAPVLGWPEWPRRRGWESTKPADLAVVAGVDAPDSSRR